MATSNLHNQEFDESDEDDQDFSAGIAHGDQDAEGEPDDEVNAVPVAVEDEEEEDDEEEDDDDDDDDDEDEEEDEEVVS